MTSLDFFWNINGKSATYWHGEYKIDFDDLAAAINVIRQKPIEIEQFRLKLAKKHGPAYVDLLCALASFITES